MSSSRAIIGSNGAPGKMNLVLGQAEGAIGLLAKAEHLFRSRMVLRITKKIDLGGWASIDEDFHPTPAVN